MAVQHEYHIHAPPSEEHSMPEPEIGTIRVVDTHDNGAAVILDCILKTADGKYHAFLLRGKLSSLAKEYEGFSDARKALQDLPERHRMTV
ncbi:MAG: hypothetical protein F4152_06520 [Dehalococcoidia bacterium]|nr:hypothetical protein [Dehalococcoidia bacterium]